MTVTSGSVTISKQIIVNESGLTKVLTDDDVGAYAGVVYERAE